MTFRTRPPIVKTLSRRTVLGGALATGLVGCKKKPVVIQNPLFPTGVTAGDASADSVLLSTNYQGQVPLQLAVWKGSELIDSRIVTPNEGGFVETLVEGLIDDTPYEYVFSEDPENPASTRDRRAHV